MPLPAVCNKFCYPARAVDQQVNAIQPKHDNRLARLAWGGMIAVPEQEPAQSFHVPVFLANAEIFCLRERMRKPRLDVLLDEAAKRILRAIVSVRMRLDERIDPLHA